MTRVKYLHLEFYDNEKISVEELYKFSVVIKTLELVEFFLSGIIPKKYTLI